MIETNRPICVMDELIKPNYSDPHRDWSKYTLISSDEEWREPDDHDHQWEACNAWWSKPNPAYVESDEFSIQNIYVRCMEPAIYYVSISGGACAEGTLTFCEFHRPKVRENT